MVKLTILATMNKKRKKRLKVLNIRNERGLYYQPYRNIKDFKGIS
jgi:hypothetical protein